MKSPPNLVRGQMGNRDPVRHLGAPLRLVKRRKTRMNSNDRAVRTNIPSQKRRKRQKTQLLCELNEAETEVEYPVFARNRSKIFRFCAQFVAILMNFG